MSLTIAAETHPSLGLSPDRLVNLLYQMQLTRAFEETAFDQYALGKVHGTMHLYVGEEAAAIGSIAAIRPDDLIVSTHRGHGHAIAKGQDINTMMAELLAKETGVCRGRGGSMHMADLSLGSLGANGVVGGGLPLSVGAGLSVKMKGGDQVVLCFFGDGASNEGAFHESVNMSAVWKLPVVYICENNQYAMSMPVGRGVSATHISDRAVGYGIPGMLVDGMDVLAVYKAVREAVAHARSGAGPVLLDVVTYRYVGHSKSDKQVYRSPDEVKEWRKRDPINLFQDWLIKQGHLTEDGAKALKARVDQTIEDAIAFGDASPEPSIAHLTDDVYSEEPEVLADPEHVLPAWIREKFGPNTPINPEPGKREISYSEALKEAMAMALAYDRDAYLIGEDIGVYGGAFQVTAGLIEEFGPERVRDTPVTEAAIAGAAVGSAVTGMRPIAEMQFMDFLTLAMEQLVLQGAKIRYMFGGKAQVPMVLRLPAGSGTGAAAQHSESLESWLVNVPGLKVVAPSTPYEAKGMLLAAIADNNPVMFVENKLLYKVKGPVPEEPYIVPLGTARYGAPGKDATIVATSIMVPRSLEAAEKLAQEGIDLEVIDLRC